MMLIEPGIDEVPRLDRQQGAPIFKVGAPFCLTTSEI